VHHRGVPDDRPALVALEPADEVPPHLHAGSGDLRGLGGRLLVAVFADLGDAEPGQRHHVGGRIGLADRDEIHRIG
jgi:hypothetical protein